MNHNSMYQYFIKSKIIDFKYRHYGIAENVLINGRKLSFYSKQVGLQRTKTCDADLGSPFPPQ